MAVYVFGEPGGLLVKVGYSGHPRERAEALRRFWGAGTVLYAHPAGTEMAERLAHRFLRQRYWFDGEWFACGDAVAKAAVRRSVALIEARRREALRQSRRKTPQRVKQLLAVMGCEKRGLTAEERRQVEAAWCAAGGRPRRQERRAA